ncbi:Rap1a/Tai family immunity protein [Paracoccus sanguinis]|uniref:Rap1a/Tai family immunity protein n=1 Tax=Paracoccus sanguinis TaxID=1545044 RepID=UPI0012E0240B|nr:Rap1a/Tai family immunity protein [Paracoccus sanguinis]
MGKTVKWWRALLLATPLLSAPLALEADSAEMPTSTLVALHQRQEEWAKAAIKFYFYGYIQGFKASRLNAESVHFVEVHQRAPTDEEAISMIRKANDQKTPFCLPAETSFDQIIDGVLMDIRGHKNAPTEAFLAVMDSLRRVYPC